MLQELDGRVTKLHHPMSQALYLKSWDTGKRTVLDMVLHSLVTWTCTQGGAQRILMRITLEM